ncbi:hypothetical protein RPHASCH2410_CH02340 [Rhizobium phaseoli Ch24-10]|nr:hypothetical protein RPHASCH2410_CH02340 [Rhizobium phaseoli Ch24-10]
MGQSLKLSPRPLYRPEFASDVCFWHSRFRTASLAITTIGYCRPSRRFRRRRRETLATPSRWLGMGVLESRRPIDRRYARSSISAVGLRCSAHGTEEDHD